MRIDERIARCFSWLRSTEYDPLKEYLRAERQGVLEQMAQVQDEKVIYRLQGEAVALKRFLDNIENAEALITKLKR
jgi:hypothetical protein